MSNEIYRWVKASERLPKGYNPQLFILVEGTRSIGRYSTHHELWFDDAGDAFPSEQIEWLEKVEAGATSSSTVKNLEREVEGLKGLIETMFKKNNHHLLKGLNDTKESVKDYLENKWQQFKTENNL